MAQLHFLLSYQNFYLRNTDKHNLWTGVFNFLGLPAKVLIIPLLAEVGYNSGNLLMAGLRSIRIPLLQAFGLT
jgi:hypothetical protein